MKKVDWSAEFRNPALVTDERLEDMRKEALAVDAENQEGFRKVQQALATYEKAYAEFFSTHPSVYNRRTTGQRYVATPMGYRLNMSLLEELKRSRERAKIEQARKQREREEEQRREEEKRKKDDELQQLLTRYSLPEDSDWEDLLSHLCGKDRYLDLAMAGLMTRMDWSDGYWRVADALKRFRLLDERDKDIAADLLGCCRDEDFDGRAFRDTEWNYEKLFSLVEDKQLVEDAKLCGDRLAGY